LYRRKTDTRYNVQMPTPATFLKSQKTQVRHTLNLAIALGLSNGFLLIFQAWLLAQVVNTTIIEKLPLSASMHWLWLMPGVFVLRAGLVWASEHTAFKAAAVIKRRLRQELHQHLQALGPAYLGSERSGEVVTTLVDGVEALEDYYAKYLPTMSLVVLIPLSILVFVFPVDWVSALVMLGTAPLIPFFMILIGKGTERLNKKQWRKLARMSAHFLDMIQGLTTLKIFNASRREADIISRVSDAYRRSTMSVLRVAFLSSLVLEFLATVSIAIVAVLIGFRLFYGEMDFLYGFFVLLLAPEFYLPLRNMGTHYHARLAAIGAAEKIVEILHTPVPVSPATQAANEMIDTNWQAIRFQHVSYAYEAGRPAIHQLSLTIPRNRCIALVGASGSGKTTLSRLLLGFIQPQQGEIRIGEQILQASNIQSWQQQIAWVPQTPHLFHGSIMENIALGNPEASREAVRQAAKLASADEFINALEQGYDTQLGDKGQGISGGQAQRLALARAFLKNAPLIILDEATANLDRHSEQQIQQAVEQLAQHSTLLVIAHRLRTVTRADLILVMQEGQIVEQGTHDSLLAAQGHYAALVEQFIAAEGAL